MAKYKKVKRYHRSFYSPGMWVKKAVGIIVLVADRKSTFTVC